MVRIHVDLSDFVEDGYVTPLSGFFLSGMLAGAEHDASLVGLDHGEEGSVLGVEWRVRMWR